MCIFKSTHFDREILIISKFGLVEKCSEGAGKILGLNEELNNKHIEDLLSLSFIDFPYYKNNNSRYTNIKSSKEKELRVA